MQESTVTIKGQTTLPKPIRDVLDMRPGDKIRYVVIGDEVRISKARHAQELSGILKGRGPTVSLEEMDAAIAKGAIE